MTSYTDDYIDTLANSYILYKLGLRTRKLEQYFLEPDGRKVNKAVRSLILAKFIDRLDDELLVTSKAYDISPEIEVSLLDLWAKGVDYHVVGNQNNPFAVSFFSTQHNYTLNHHQRKYILNRELNPETTGKYKWYISLRTTNKPHGPLTFQQLLDFINTEKVTIYDMLGIYVTDDELQKRALQVLKTKATEHFLRTCGVSTVLRLANQTDNAPPQTFILSSPPETWEKDIKDILERKTKELKILSEHVRSLQNAVDYIENYGLEATIENVKEFRFAPSTTNNK